MSDLSQQSMGWIASILGVIVIVASFMVGYNAGLLQGGYTMETENVPGETYQGAAVKGELDAPVTIVEWSDFECPFCARFYQQTLPSIEEQYVRTGKAKFVYKDFPLSIHANAQKAAEAGKCALAQGNEYFWALHDRIFNGLVAGQKPTVPTLKAYAGEVGLDQDAFDSCLDSGRMAGAVQQDMQEGQQRGVRGTTGFRIYGPGDEEGTLISGAQPFAAFQQAIDAKLE